MVFFCHTLTIAKRTDIHKSWGILSIVLNVRKITADLPASAAFVKSKKINKKGGLSPPSLIT